MTWATSSRARESPSVITNRSYTFTAMWAPSEVTVYLGTNGGEWIRNPGDPGLAHPDEAGEFTLTAGNDFAMAVQNTAAPSSCRPTSTSWSARAIASWATPRAPVGK